MSACAIASLQGRLFNKSPLKLPILLNACRSFRSQLNPYRLRSYRAESGNNSLRSRNLFGWKNQEILAREKVVLSASSVRTFRSANHANNEEEDSKVKQQSPAKKQLKSEDIFRILSLAKPEYKSLAGN